MDLSLFETLTPRWTDVCERMSVFVLVSWNASFTGAGKGESPGDYVADNGRREGGTLGSAFPGRSHCFVFTLVLWQCLFGIMTINNKTA